MRIIGTEPRPHGAATIIEFTESEMRVKDRFDYYLDRGHNIPAAAELALNEALRRQETFEPEFIEHLSDGTVTLCSDGWVSSGNEVA